jgi:prolyl 4-hydroxylase
MILMPMNIIESYDDYQIIEYPNFLTDEECDNIINIAKNKGLTKSSLYNGSRDDYDDSVRISEQTWLFDNENTFIATMSEKIAKLVNIPVSHQEAMQVVHYDVGGKYEPHFDACIESCDRMNGKGGNRYLTVLLYLNDVMEGGETSFPIINKKVKPEKRKAVLFYNINKNTEEIIQESKHGGNPIIKGEKWLANKWIHIRAL